MRRVFVALMMVIMSCFSVSMLVPSGSVYAADGSCDRNFLTFVPWYKGLSEKDGNGKCVIKAPDGKGGRPTLTVFIWTIVMNVLTDLFGAVGYLSVAFLIYGGYQYAIARGDPGRVAKGKKTIVAAITGLVIAILATVITSTIVVALTGG